MVLCVCLDDNNGLTFNHRRQSQDRIQRERLLKIAAGHILAMSPYTYKLYQLQLPVGVKLIVDENFWDKAPEDAFCVVESAGASQYIDRVDKIVVYRWNRVYPADVHFDVNLSHDGGWRLCRTTIFPGTSHPEMVEEIWMKCETH